ncbi:unnamed protein product [Cyclocybe aegerita]|uniref:Uncharacterized protein n=1 Tax=Cyclocybe aegerita TaxID=1973307 RepID=A0A8S0WXM5_CYCAE|nr:unnamed protein product [Cyclocybe aegerita]
MIVEVDERIQQEHPDFLSRIKNRPRYAPGKKDDRESLKPQMSSNQPVNMKTEPRMAIQPSRRRDSTICPMLLIPTKLYRWYFSLFLAAGGEGYITAIRTISRLTNASSPLNQASSEPHVIRHQGKPKSCISRYHRSKLCECDEPIQEEERTDELLAISSREASTLRVPPNVVYRTHVPIRQLLGILTQPIGAAEPDTGLLWSPSPLIPSPSWREPLDSATPCCLSPEDVDNPLLSA